MRRLANASQLRRLRKRHKSHVYIERGGEGTPNPSSHVLHDKQENESESCPLNLPSVGARNEREIKCYLKPFPCLGHSLFQSLFGSKSAYVRVAEQAGALDGIRVRRLAQN